MKHLLHVCTAGIAMLLGLSTSYAQEGRAAESSTAQSVAESPMPQIHPKDFYALATIVEGKPSAVFGKITNHTNKPVALVKAQILGAHKGTAELHQSSKKDGAMIMQQIQQIEIPADSTIELAHGGLHIMLLDLTPPLKAGQTLSLKLYFDDDSSAVLEVPVRERAGGAQMSEHSAKAHAH